MNYNERQSPQSKWDNQEAYYHWYPLLSIIASKELFGDQLSAVGRLLISVSVSHADFEVYDATGLTVTEMVASSIDDSVNSNNTACLNTIWTRDLRLMISANIADKKSKSSNISLSVQKEEDFSEIDSQNDRLGNKD
ncbi:uncharacterized protein LOC117327141 [Pecten maximus]|uniref:uncharacterized protein LOC117327141 n=1 Tax=Pecten maximus TaxID=6579 RepID=UPI0014581373|nr:uncharacterized protein LOC117327141 [Pecten maximus]